MTRKQVQYDGQIKPAFVSANVRDVVHPDPIRFLHVELELHMIRRHQRRGTTAFIFPLGVVGLRPNSGRPHETMGAINTASLTEFAQIIADLTVAVDAAAFEPRFLESGLEGACLPWRLLSEFKRQA